MKRLSIQIVAKGITLLTEVPQFSSSAFSFLGVVYKIRRRKSEGAGKFPLSLLRTEQPAQTHTIKHTSVHTHRTLHNNTSLSLLRAAAPHMEVSWISRFPQQRSSGLSPAQRPRTRSPPPQSTIWRRTGPSFNPSAESLSVLPWFAVCVTDLRTAPVLRLTFSVMRLRICSRSCRMLRGMMNRNGGHRRSPLRKTLKKKISSKFYRP